MQCYSQILFIEKPYDYNYYTTCIYIIEQLLLNRYKFKKFKITL